MINNDRVRLIQTRLHNAFSPTQLAVIDESDQHSGHVAYQGGGRHFAIEIAASYFNTLSRIEAHRQIYALFADLIPEQIHALKIKVVHPL